MNSSRYVDYRLRKNKAIERVAIFDGLNRLTRTSKLDYRYVGLGSVWFVDFEMAHRLLGVKDMVSIEADPVIAARAKFNAPFRTITVRDGYSYDVIPDLLNEFGAERPWILWLDFDYPADEQSIDELRARIVDLPDNSIFLATFNAAAHKYGQKPTRRVFMEQMFGDSFPSERFSSNGDFGNEQLFAGALADALLSTMREASVNGGRLGGFVECVRFQYQDGAPMVTIGGILPSPENRASMLELTGSTSWPCLRDRPLLVPPLTQREVGALRRLMPAGNVSRDEVRLLGFDLEDEDIDSFVENYLHYPLFAQVAE